MNFSSGTRSATAALLLSVLGLPTMAAGVPGVVLEAERASGEPEQAAAGFVSVCPPDLDPDTTRIEVRDSAGNVRDHAVLQWRRGDPLHLWFAVTPDDRRVVIALRRQDPKGEPVATWKPRSGLLLETRPRSGGDAETLEQAQTQWNEAGGFFGRGLVPQVHLGIHPFGPETNLLARYSGALRIPRAGRYGFATVSRDASFLLINDRLVAEWPGWHDASDGITARYRGEIELAEGLHRLVYYNVQRESGFLTTAAWRPPDADTYRVIPAEAFEPVARFDVRRLRIEGLPGRTAAIRRDSHQHAVAGGIPMVVMTFSALNVEEPAQCRWIFHDGTRREGHSVGHTYAETGLHELVLEVLRDERVVDRAVRSVRVEPNWAQPHEYPEDLVDRIRVDLDARDPTRMSAAALAGIVRFLDAVPDRDRLNRWGRAVIARSAEFEHDRAEALYRMGFHFQHPDIQDLDTARQAWERLLENRNVPGDVRGRTRLHLSGLLVHGFGEAAAADRHLARLDPGVLDSVDRRLAEIFAADHRVLQGDLDGAAAGYAAIGTVPAPDDTRSAVRTRVRLETAQRYLEKAEYDAVEQIVRLVEWEYPLARMGLETGLLMVGAHRGRGETQFALQACRRLLAVSTGHPLRPRLMQISVELHRDAGQDAAADRIEQELLRNYPYSEAAAILQNRRQP